MLTNIIQNIEKAKKQIEKLEQEGANGDKVAEITEGVKDASLNDKQES